MSGIDVRLLENQNLSDENLEYFDTKKEITKEWSKSPRQRYTGEVLHGNLHGRGFYLIEREEKIFYDGFFYANKLEGYSQVFHNDSSNFQGLFKGNVRFGPGVLTYPNGQQDVGLWMGSSLIRLGSLNDRNIVPRLATSPLGQLKLLKYRYLVPVCSKRFDIAYDTLKRLGANERVLQNSYKLYNMDVKNKSNIFFNKKLFNQQFYANQDCSIDIVIDEYEDISEDDKKAEPQEETPAHLSDINVERVRQLSQQMEVIEGRLQGVVEKRATIKKDVDYCKSCCHLEEPGEVSTKSPQSPETSESSSQEISKTDSEDDFPVRREQSVRIQDYVKIDTYSAYSTEDDVSTLYSSDDQHTISNYEEDWFAPTETSDVTGQIKDYLMDACICDEVMDTQDLYEMEKRLKVLKKEEAFFECILKNLKEKLEMHMKKSENSNNVKTRQISVKDVLAWNNEERCMRMLKHGFLHRNSEYMVKFDVSDLIAGKREEFGEPGPQEKHCLKFLNACYEGDTETILRLTNENNISVNVCDAKGNGGMFLAAVNREIDTIKLLVTLGAKIDAVNDEGLLPLSMCLLVYLAEKNGIYDWEKSFLPDEVEPMIEQRNAYKWYQNMSLNVLARHGRTTYSFMEEVKFKESEMNLFKSHREDYFFKIGCPVAKSEDLRKSVVYNPRVTTSYTHRRSIEDSIKTLLACGANPNAGEAPLPPLFLSLFTENLNLVESVLGANADINTTIEEEMTALHVVASLKSTQTNADICYLLLEYDCDPRLRTTPDHWPEQKKFVLGNIENPNEVEDFGKNPLHIICLRGDFATDRYSFFQQMVMALCESRIDCNERYLGHTPLSLAVLIGNKDLVETLIDLNVIDPYQQLDYDMGNVLTIYILRRYQDRLPPNAKEILACLVKLGVNPLRSVGEFENTIAFMDNEHAVQRTKSSKGRLHETGQRKTQKSQEELKGISQGDALRQYIIKLARNTIVKYIQLHAVHTLYNFIEDGLTDHKCVVILSEFLNADVIISNLQYLFKYGKINHSRFDKNICLKLIDIVNKNQEAMKFNEEIPEEDGKEPKKNSKRSSKKSRTKISQMSLTNEETETRYSAVFINTSDYSHILDMTDFKKIDKKQSKFKLLHAGLDNKTKYKVCFNCLKRQNKTLLLCPRCQLVYLCSKECNKASLKLRTVHACNLNLYDSGKERLEEENHSDLYARVEESCENRRKQKLEEDINLARIRFLEERKSDTYGTKLVKWMREDKMQVKRTPTNLTLLGSASELARYKSETESVGKEETHDSLARRTFSGSDKHMTFFKESLQHQHILKYRPMAKQRVDSKKHDDRCHHEHCIAKNREGVAVCSCRRDSREAVESIKTNEETETSIETHVIVRKLRNIPTKYETFIGLLTRYFPEVDYSSLFLPYTCYSNGHLYYKFSDNELGNRTYSMM